jgi:hypothetical protein
VSPRALEEIVRPRLQLGASGRPLNSSVRSRHVLPRSSSPSCTDPAHPASPSHSACLEANHGRWIGGFHTSLSYVSFQCLSDASNGGLLLDGSTNGVGGYLVGHMHPISVGSDRMPLLWPAVRSTPNGCVLAAHSFKVRGMRIRCGVRASISRLLTIVGGGRQSR